MAQKKSVESSQPSNITDETTIVVRRGRVDSVDLYEVKDNELDTLEKGSPADIQLNFAIFLLSLAFAGFASLLTAEFKSTIIQTFFIIVVVTGLFIGLYFLLCWKRNRTSISDVIKTIRNRIPPEAVVPTQTETTPTQPNPTDSPSC